MPTTDPTPKPTLVATLAIVVIAVLTLGSIYLLMGPLPEGFDRPGITDVLAIIGAVVAPIVSIAAAYYGIAIALKANSESRALIEQSTKAAIETAEGFTTAVTNITIDLHNQNLQLIAALQRGNAFEPDDLSGGNHVPTATGPIPRPAAQHTNANDVGLPDTRP